MRRFLLISLSAIAALIIAAATAYAAGGKLTGKAVDAKTGEPVVGASVRIDDTQLGGAVGVDGMYVVLDIPPGVHDVTLTGVGYTKTTVRGVVIHSDLTTFQNFQVEPATVGLPEVVVEAQKPVIDITQTSGQSIMTSTQITNLPAANLQTILATSPSTFNGYVRGGKRFETSYIVDGIDLSDKTYESANAGNSLFNTYLAVNKTFRQNNNLVDLGSDALQEVAVNTTSNVKYSPATAGVVDMTLKQGAGKIAGNVVVKYASSLQAAGLDVYTGLLPDGTTAESKYMNEEASLATSNPSKAARYTWTPGEYWYANKPTENVQFSLGGGITNDVGFMVNAKYINSYGMYPNDFNRSLNATATINWALQPTLKLTGIGILSDQGYFLGWRNSMYNEDFKFYLQGVPRYALGTAAGSLKLVNTLSDNTYYEVQASYTDSPDEVGFIQSGGQINPLGVTSGDFLTFADPAQLQQYVSNIDFTKFFSVTPQNETPTESAFPSSSSPYKLSRPGVYYEKQATQQYNVRGDFNSQINSHHLLTGGLNLQFYNYSNLRRFSPSGYVDVEDYTVHPKQYGLYAQDRMTYSGVIVNAGVRVDGWDAGAKEIGNYFAPYTFVSDSEVLGGVNKNGTPEVVKFNDMVVNRTKDVPVKWLFEPMIGISHPISDRASMYYSFSRTMQPLPFSALYGISYQKFHTSLPNVSLIDQDPMKSTNYEMGLQYAISDYFGVNVSAYYRTIKNYNQMGYTVVPRAGIGSLYSIFFYGGSADVRGIELTLRSNSLPVGDVLRLSGDVTYTYSYVRSLAGGTVLRGQNNGTFFTTAGDSAKYNGDLPFGNADYYAGYEQYILGANSSSFAGYDRSHRVTFILNFDFPRPFSSVPLDFHLNTFTTYQSGFLYPITAADPRSRQIGTAPYNMRTDLRLEADFSIAGLRVAPFVEILNVFNRENIIAYDNSTAGQQMWEQKGIPTGPYGWAVLPDGSSVYDIGRQVYSGVAINF
ncbi:MAG: TonB-dependent receptor [Bacteroidota bacterium]|nr:TonB-dependent receptor [Bacteroidota bacterium]